MISTVSPSRSVTSANVARRTTRPSNRNRDAFGSKLEFQEQFGHGDPVTHGAHLAVDCSVHEAPFEAAEAASSARVMTIRNANGMGR